MNIEFELQGAEATALALLHLKNKVPAVIDPVVIDYGRRLETQVKRNASGRPGPNAITGNYRRSWTTKVSRGANGVDVRVGTNAPQAHRLEYGFHGVDAVGRSYSQPPFPHAGPAMDVIRPQLIGAVQRALKGIAL